MKKLSVNGILLALLILSVMLLMGMGCAPEEAGEKVTETVAEIADEIEIITIRAWTIGPDAPAFYRAENLSLAAERLNSMLEVAGSKVRVEVEADFWTVSTGSWEDFRKRADLAFAGRDPEIVPDIILSSHLDVATWAEAGWITPLDAYIEKYWDCTYQDFFPHLWEAVSWQGEKWAVPQDIEVRMVWFRKDHLRALGWTEEEIENLPQRVAEKEFLLDDLLQVAREMEKAGLVEHGILHRPPAGPCFLQFLVAYEGEYFDEATGNLVIDHYPLLEMLQFFERAVHEYQVLPAEMTEWSGTEVHTAIALEGTAGFQITGGMWHWAEWLRDLDIPEEQLWENIGWTLIPAGNLAGRPNQLGHPLAYMVAEVSPHKDLAALLITLASSVDLNTNHALTGAKLAIRQSQVAFQPFRENKYLSAVAELLPYQVFAPLHPMTRVFLAIIYDAIKGVQTGAMSPEAALDFIIHRARLDIGYENIIIR